MADDDELAAIREKKRDELLESTDGADGESDSVGDGTPDEPVHVEGGDHLESLTADHRLVLVDCYADWCGPCKMLEPTVRELATDEDLAVAKMDVDAHQGLARRLGVQGVPTLFLYVDGEPVKRLVGVQDAGTLRDLVDQFR